MGMTGENTETKNGEQLWAEDVWQRMENKLYRTMTKNGNKILYTIDRDGNGEDRYSQRSSIWINGFWPGVLWQFISGNNRGKKV